MQAKIFLERLCFRCDVTNLDQLTALYDGAEQYFGGGYHLSSLIPLSQNTDQSCGCQQGCIICSILPSGMGARGLSSEHVENMEMFSLFFNLGALGFSENLIRYSLHICLREVKNNLVSFRHYLWHFS